MQRRAHDSMNDWQSQDVLTQHRTVKHRWRLILSVLLSGLLLQAGVVRADPISQTPSFFFAGNLDFAITGGTLRTQSNGVNACSVGTSNTALLSGVPPGANVIAAYLYWAGSGSTPDNQVQFRGATVNAGRTFSETFNFGALSFDFFSGFADVTALVTGNGSYTFSGLTVTNTDQGTSAPYCSRAAVLSGWGLIAVYEDPSEPLRVINLFDGFQSFRGSQIQVTPNNFLVPANPVDGRIAILTWEGDVENSTPANSVSENLVFDGQSTAAINLTDTVNPLNNQFNSTINVNGTTNSFGVDFDNYDISSRLRAGDNSAVTTYASGGDLVLLSLQAVSTTNTAVADLTLAKRLASSSFSNAAPATYGLAVSNLGPSPAAGPITVTDSLPADLTFLSASSADGSWICTGGDPVTCNHPGPLAAGSTLPELLLTTTVDPAISAPIINQAAVASATFDGDTSNNSTSLPVGTVVTPDISSSRKLAQDLNGGNLVAGDTVRYRIVIEETAGAAISDLRMEDTLDPLLGSPSFVNLAGGTDASSGNQLLITGLSVPASGTVTVVFDAVVGPSAVDGDLINNRARLLKAANGIAVDIDAPELAVGSNVIPTSGIKPLYFGDIAGSTNNPALPLAMSRTPLTGNSNPVRVRIRRQDNNREWRLTPLLAAPLGIDDEVIPVRLFMRRNNQTNTRPIRVTLTHGSGNVFVGCAQRSLLGTGSAGLSNSVTRGFDFNVARTDANCNPIAGAPITVPAGSFLSITVDNDPAGGSGRAVFVYPFDSTTAESSRIELPATTIINVDSVGVFDASGGGSVVSEAAAGNTIFLRASVSDPFGAFDITGASFELSDPSSGVVASGPMTQLSSAGAGKVYEAPFTVPLDASNGTWSLAVTAAEGTEGTITHTGFGSFTVTGGAGLTVEKTIEVLSDGGNGTPKAIPGAEVEYTIRVTNTGADPIEANSIFIRDLLPPELKLVLSPNDPVVLVEGTPASGLTLSYDNLSSTSDDVSFSNDGGNSFITPNVDSNGLDQTVPPIDYLQINPQGMMPGNSGVPPSFELRLRMRIP